MHPSTQYFSKLGMPVVENIKLSVSVGYDLHGCGCGLPGWFHFIKSNSDSVIISTTRFININYYEWLMLNVRFTSEERIKYERLCRSLKHSEFTKQSAEIQSAYTESKQDAFPYGNIQDTPCISQ